MEMLPEDWQSILDEDPYLARAQAIAQGEGRLEFSTLASIWLGILSEVGLRGIDPSTGSPPKEEATYHPKSEPLYSNALPVRLKDSREHLWLKFNGRRSEQGYRKIQILDMPLRTNTAILAALTALEGRQIDVDALDDTSVEGVLDTSENGLTEEEAIEEELTELVTELEDDELERLASSQIYDDPDLATHVALEYVAAVLRHYRPEFDTLPYSERVALLKDGCRRVNEVLESLRKWVGFLEYGVPERDLRSKLEKAARDIRAAELRDIEGLSKREIGERLGITPPPSDIVRRTNSTAGAAADRGRELVVRALGEVGWQQLIETKKAERDGFLALSEEVRSVMVLADRLGIPVEDARNLVNNVGADPDES
jgi:hypothetical protein